MSDPGFCAACASPRETTDRTRGVWTTCDYCGADWWCVVAERDYLDEPTAFACSGGCGDGWLCDCAEDDWHDEDEDEA